MSKTAVILGVANRRSIAWACVESFIQRGYRVVFTYQNERFEKTAIDLKNSLCGKETSLSLSCLPLDVQQNNEIPLFFDERLPELIGVDEKVDSIVHSIAYSPPDAMKEGTLLKTSRESFLQTQDISAYSFLEVARCSTNLLAKETTTTSSLTALSYLGAVRAVPNYNAMGPAKASLEALVRGLALELGPNGTRVNAVSAGPLNTLAARGISGFSKIRHEMEERAPLSRNVTPEEVANTIAFLASSDASGITGQTIYVDGGYSVVAGGGGGK